MKNYATLRVSALNCSRVLNLLQQQGICASHIVKTEAGIELQIPLKQFKIAEQCFADRRVEYTVVRRTSARTRAASLLRHVGLIATAAVCAVLLWGMTQLCYDIGITCSDPQLSAQAQNYLKEAGIDGIFWKSKIDLKETERALVASNPSIAFASVQFRGGILDVTLIPQHNIPDGETPQYTRIVADRDCVVTRILVYSGTAVVQEGDVVKKGDPLIEGYLDMGDPADPNNVRMPVAAKGEIYGRVWLSDRLIVPCVGKRAVATGNEETKRILTFGRKEAAIPECGYEHWESTTERIVFGTLFPITVTVMTFREVTYEDYEVSEQELNEMSAQAQMRLWREIPPDAKVLTSRNSQKRLDNFYILEIYYELEQSVSQGSVS